MASKKNDKKWIQGAIKRPGAFTAKAKRRKMTVAQFASAVRKNPLVATMQRLGVKQILAVTSAKDFKE
jgi:hypothetical protein